MPFITTLNPNNPNIYQNIYQQSQKTFNQSRIWRSFIGYVLTVVIKGVNDNDNGGRERDKS